jgi:hypothetical protein
MSKDLVPISAAMLESAAGDAKNWIHSNGNYANSRFYPGAQINTANVASSSRRSCSRRQCLNRWKPRRSSSTGSCS